MSSITYVLTTNGVLFLLAVIFWKFPPKKINGLYGYRTHKAMLNEKIWNFANTTFNKTFLMYSGFSFLGGLLLASFSFKELTWEPMVLVMLSILVSIIKTERALSDNFTEQGKSK
ncbi:SdpI/YhfL protein family protein [Polaribacter sp. Hel1_33_78]|uniref:SdpI family protein n=1 Tax=Polaribacter sp. Hel1_33_78 TaxID=1336804 RepID=UPI0008799B44|nr:SdpI family protein [Polaribacter sp. Hel1_33_78]SDU24740.1 SdpI/YhfL protein family protein [Polaribacter sp. Hel1_33_78]